jgi:hypothetical protein
VIIMATTPHRLDEIKGKAKAAFAKANPEIWKKIQGDPEKIQQAKEIRERARYIRLRMKTHIYKNRQTWVSQEAVRILEEHGRQILKYPRPSWALDRPFGVSYLEEARRRVQSRNQMRMQRINTAEDRMKLAVIQAQESGRRAPDLESRVLKIVSRAQELRANAKKEFRLNRNRWLHEARERGANNPERAVFTRQRDRMAQIDQDEQKQIRQAFKAHGQALPERQEKALVRDFNHSM